MLPPPGSSAPAPAPEPKIWQVGELVRAMKRSLETGFASLAVEGEISSWKVAQSGHAYFSLQDETAKLDCCLYHLARHRLPFAPAPGQRVRATGTATIYPARGSLQLFVRSLSLAGAGDLAARFEALKRALAAEGLFAAERKRPLPRFPQHIGIVTSPAGAAIRDILRVLSRRFANLHLVIAPVLVQGAGAAAQIAEAVDFFNSPRAPAVDVIVVTRGGGSLEDLWAFNEEAVVRALARSRIPTLSAVGHDIDTSLSDFAADASAPTPSAGAEILIRAKSEIADSLLAYSRRLRLPLATAAARAKERLVRAASTPFLRDPKRVLAERAQAVDLLAERLKAPLANFPLARRRRLEAAARTVRETLVSRAAASRRRLDVASHRLALLDPGNVLARGYTLTRSLDTGRLLRSPAEARDGERLETRFAEGTLASRAEKT